jgi:type IX secretion system PorP/SprF family membrane protein
MDLKFYILDVKSVLFIFIYTFSFNLLNGQQTPLDPISYWVFTPYIYNPAIIGSKDFLSIDFNAAFKGESNTQILSGNTRFSKTRLGYFSSPEIKEFNNFGIGGSVFQDFKGLSQNIGASVAVSYQIPLNTRKLSFLSFGISAKGVYNILDTSSAEPGNPSKKTIFPNVDLGIYYFGTNFFAGLSTTDLFGNPENPDSLGKYAIPLSRKYLFSAGYKFLLSRSLNIVLEPSIFFSAYDSTIAKIRDNFNPILKVYLENFCFGTNFFYKNNALFFFQYKYSRFYVGAFFELPIKSPYFKKTPIVEITTGINIQIDKSRFSRHSHW